MPSQIDQFKTIWTRLPLNGKIATFGATLGTFGLLAAIIYYGSQPTYGVLFSDLKPADAQTIVEKLKASNVPYSLTNNGTTVEVPADRISELRIQMAGEGTLSGGHVGFDLFDKTSFGATDFAQQVNYRRAIEGELGRTLEGMDEVESARVHITPRKDSVFTEKEEGAKASVTLRIRQGKELSNERTDAVVSLVASAVEGLDPADVAVLDTRGRLLTKGGRGKNGSMSDAGAFSERLDAKQAFEAESASRVIALLEPVVGEGKVRADVSADIDFSQIEQTEEKYNPQSQVIRSQQTAQESRNSRSPASGGLVGARANDPTAPAPAPPEQAQAASSGDQRLSSTTNYEIDKTVKRTVGGGGQINRMTVSVVVDSKTVEGVDVARQSDELQKLQEIVSAAIGANPARGDSVVVQTMPFNKPPTEPAGAASFLETNRSLIETAVKYGLLVAVALLIFLFVIRPAKKSLRMAIAAAPSQKMLPAGGGTAMLEMPQMSDAAGEKRSVQTVKEMEAKMLAQLEAETPQLSKEAQRSMAVKKVIADETIQNPESVAGTLRGWIQEG